MVQFSGLEALQDKLRRNAPLLDVQMVVRSNGAELTRNAQALAPVDTSRMKNATLMFLEDGNMTSGVRVHTNYAGYVDKGTRFMSAKPFVGNSFNLQALNFKREINMLMK